MKSDVENIEDIAIKIRKLSQILSIKSADMHITYSGTELGQNNPWKVAIHNEEANGQTLLKAINTLYQILVEKNKHKLNSIKLEASILEEKLSEMLSN